MLKAILLLVMSLSLWAADDHATMSLQRYQNFLVVTVDHDKGWHTYWKNPGDSGLPSTFKFSQGGKPLELKPLEWPVPTKHLEAGDILTIGYEGRQHFFFENKSGAIDAHITVLICQDICIPGEAKLTLASGQPFVANRKVDAYSDSVLAQAKNDLPQSGNLPKGFEYYLTRVKGQNLLTLHYSLKGATGTKLPRELGFLTAFPKPPFGYKRESLFFKEGTLYGKTEIEWDGEYQEPPVALSAEGNFPKAYDLDFLLNAPGSTKVEKVTLKIKDFSLASPALDDFYKSLGGGDKKVSAVSPLAEGKIFKYLFFAFIGGLILNLMPCVLPVISLKLFGLIKHKEYTQKKLFAHNLSYTAGVLATFMGLATVIAILKTTGEEIGWGFQLQSPGFILFMMLVLFVLSLNLFGLFEFATPGGSTFGGKQLDQGLKGDFFSGVLTTILSTPCSAPFLGTALTFAFTTSTFNIYLMFSFIGLGLAFPFMLTAIFPKTLQIFPKPGMWMEKLKYFLGLSLLATIIWLYDVFVSLVNYESVSWKLNLLFALWFFAFFFAQKVTKNRVFQFVAFSFPLVLTVLAIQNFKTKAEYDLTFVKSEWSPWSEAKMNENTGKLVFVDFTAEWCLTCKVNKKLVLETDGFEALKKKYDLVVMRADWTKRDDNITKYLRKYNAVGVPAYFVQRKDGKVEFLGETLTLAKIESYLN